jgi:hypothetical protein
MGRGVILWKWAELTIKLLISSRASSNQTARVIMATKQTRTRLHLFVSIRFVSTDVYFKKEYASTLLSLSFLRPFRTETTINKK